MEFEISCDVCLIEFNENIVVPKMLNCGHSFCLPCIKNLLEVNPNCPKCRKEMANDKASDDYPTNYSLLHAVNLGKRMEKRCTLSEEMMKKIEVLKNKLTVKKLQISTDLEQINNYLSQLQSLTNSENEITDINKAKQIVETLERKYKIDIQLYVNIHLSDYNDSKDFLISIYNRISEENIYAVKKFDNFVKYGKLTVENNAIFFSTFSESTKPDNSSIILFEELKQFENKENPLTFLKLCCNKSGDICTVIIKLVNYNQSCSQFIKLCSGENGPTYKGCIYEPFSDSCDLYSSVLEVNTYIETTLNNETIQVQPGDVFVLGEDGGGFKIYVATASIWTKSIGKVESPKNIYTFITFDDATKLKVVDCGIIFQIY